VIERRAAPTIAVAGWVVTLLDLGAIHAPLNWVFPHAEEGELAWLPSNGLLCRQGEDAVLVDCGLGPHADIFELEVRHVDVADALASNGCAAEHISTVVLSHLDADHIGGVVAGEPDRSLRPSFPLARVVVLDLGLDVLDGRATTRSELAETIGVTLREAGTRIDAVRDGVEVKPGLRVRSAPGHRTGHACVELSGHGERFVYLADGIHAREHVEHPEWDFLHDSEPELALTTRRALIDELAGSGTVVACSHVDGFGRIERGRDCTPAWVDVA